MAADVIISMSGSLCCFCFAVHWWWRMCFILVPFRVLKKQDAAGPQEVGLGVAETPGPAGAGCVRADVCADCAAVGSGVTGR